ncbi:MAG: DUF4340 domain-containing protein [Clostridia bacterium]|nr:DUF4340 domain-containing protein [Clostridia bacterium]
MSLDDIKQPVDSDTPAEETVSPADEATETSEDAFSAFSEVSRVKTKTKKVGRLSKRARTLIATSAVAIILAVALLLITLLPHGDEGPISSGTADATDVDTSVVLLDKTVKNTVTVMQIHVSNADDEYTLVYNETEKIYQLKGYEDILLASDLLNTVSTYSTVITASDQVKKPKDLSVYGLDKPAATATITYRDGSTCTIYVGNVTPSETGYYVCLKDVDGVYIFASDAVSAFTFMAAAYADTTLVSTPSVKSDDADGSAVMKEISYTGKNYPKPLFIRRSSHTDVEEMTYYSYIITEPYLRGTSDETTSIYTNFKSLSAVQALVLHPTEEQKKRIGFNDPLSVIQVTMAVETPDDSDTSDTDDAEISKYYNEVTTTITIANKDDDGHYIVMVDGINAIFLVDRDTFSVVAERNYANSVNTLLFAKHLTKINRITIKTADVSCDLDLTHLENVEDDEEDLIVAQGDEVYSSEEFRELYTLMMSIMRYDAWTDEPTADADLTIHLYNKDGSLFLGANFYSITGSRFGVETTEGEKFTTRSAEVNHFIKQIVKYLNGEDVSILT